MSDFSLCPDCRREYESIDDRRFHAETISCSRCGPNIWWKDAQGSTGQDSWREVVRNTLSLGAIVAIRGVGGYQLLCDATNPVAVHRLRRRKHRPFKPLAVLIEDMESARKCGWIDSDEESAIDDPSNPIVIIRVRADSPIAAEAVHPGIDQLGVMLPTTAMHWMIAHDIGRPLVCTSCNQEGEPLEYEPASAERQLAGIADLWIHHDRPICHPIDDSVVRVIGGRRATYRLARGMAPLPLTLPVISQAYLAMGGQMKSAVAWHNGVQACLGPHVGDLDSLSVFERYMRDIHAWQSLYGFQPDTLIGDFHPDYSPNRILARQNKLFRPVQHHHAHVVAGMLNDELIDREVLGVAWDGTGFGSDGTVWGGEFLRATLSSYQRVGRLRPFPLPGGEAAVREPWRLAATLTLDACPEDSRLIESIIGTNQLAQIRLLLNRQKLSPLSTSIGRLFDAIGWLLLGDNSIGFDGRAGMMLESIADRSETGSLSFPVERMGLLMELDWRPLVRAVVHGIRAGIPPSVISMQFHRALARAIIEVARQWLELPVVLSGGVFQNRLLVELVLEEGILKNSKQGMQQRIITPGTIPCNDGGLAAGQLAIGMSVLTAGRRIREEC